MTHLHNCVSINRKKTILKSEEAIVSQIKDIANLITQESTNVYKFTSSVYDSFTSTYRKNDTLNINLSPISDHCCKDMKIPYPVNFDYKVTNENIAAYRNIAKMHIEILNHGLLHLVGKLLERHIILPQEIGKIGYSIYRGTSVYGTTIFNELYGSVNVIEKMVDSPSIKISALIELANKTDMIITPIELFDETTILEREDRFVFNTFKKLNDSGKLGVRPWIICPIVAYSVNNHVSNKTAPNVYAPQKFSQVIMSCSLVIPTLRLLKENVDMLSQTANTTREVLNNMNENFNTMISQQKNQIGHIYKSNIYDSANKFISSNKVSEDVARSMFTIDNMLVILLPDSVQDIYSYSGDAILGASFGTKDINSKTLEFLNLEVQNKISFSSAVA